MKKVFFLINLCSSLIDIVLFMEKKVLYLLFNFPLVYKRLKVDLGQHVFFWHYKHEMVKSFVSHCGHQSVLYDIYWIFAHLRPILSELFWQIWMFSMRRVIFFYSSSLGRIGGQTQLRFQKLSFSRLQTSGKISILDWNAWTGISAMGTRHWKLVTAKVEGSRGNHRLEVPANLFLRMLETILHLRLWNFFKLCSIKCGRRHL